MWEREKGGKEKKEKKEKKVQKIGGNDTVERKRPEQTVPGSQRQFCLQTRPTSRKLTV